MVDEGPPPRSDEEEDPPCDADEVPLFSLPLVPLLSCFIPLVTEDVKTSSYRSTPSPVGSSLSCGYHPNDTVLNDAHGKSMEMQ